MLLARVGSLAAEAITTSLDFRCLHVKELKNGLLQRCARRASPA